MKKTLALIIAVVLIVSFSTVAWGAAPVGYGARAAAMGGAFTAVADDGSAPYWNPAGITQIKYVTLTPAIGLEGKYDIADTLIDESSSELPTFTDNNVELASLIYLGITTRYIGINGFVDVNGSVTSTSTEMDSRGESYGYGTLTIAGNFGDQLAIGINLKTIQAKVVYSQVNNDQSGFKYSADGDGMAYDIGILYKLSTQTRIGFTGRNVGGKVDWGTCTKTTFDMGNTNPTDTITTAPSENIPRSYVLGIAYNPNKTLTLAADVENIDAWDDNNDQTRVHLGLEQTALWNSVALRLGCYTNKGEQVGLTGGLGFKLGPILLDATCISAENIGYYITMGLKF